VVGQEGERCLKVGNEERKTEIGVKYAESWWWIESYIESEQRG
jgi:hypothetical protein